MIFVVSRMPQSLDFTGFLVIDGSHSRDEKSSFRAKACRALPSGFPQFRHPRVALPKRMEQIQIATKLQ